MWHWLKKAALELNHRNDLCICFVSQLTLADSFLALWLHSMSTSAHWAWRDNKLQGTSVAWPFQRAIDLTTWWAVTEAFLLHFSPEYLTCFGEGLKEFTQPAAPADEWSGRIFSFPFIVCQTWKSGKSKIKRLLVKLLPTLFNSWTLWTASEPDALCCYSCRKNRLRSTITTAKLSFWLKRPLS